MRTCYATDMHFYTEDDRTCRIRYYEVPDETPALDYWTPFVSSDWDSDQLGYSGLGEVWPPSREYYKGGQVGNALPNHPCGGADVWRNGQALPPPVPTPVNVFGTSICCDRAKEFRRPSDIPLRSLCALYWLATLLRTTYYNNPALFAAAARAVLFPDTAVETVPNTVSAPPGFGMARMAEGGIVCISGTTNLAQYALQIFFSSLVATGWPTPAGPDTARGLGIYIASADIIDAALDLFIDPALPVFIVGHSLGGAVGMLLLHKWNISGRRPGSVILTFGSPKPGDAALAAAIPTDPSGFLRLANELDYVPQLPPFIPAQPFVLPPPLVPFTARYNDMEQVGPITRLQNGGVMLPGPQPSLPWYLYLACQAAAAGRALPLSDPHAITSYVLRLRNGCPTLPPALISGWTDPPALDRLNAWMNVSWFGDVALVAGELAAWNPGNQILGDVGLVVAGEGAWTPAAGWVGDVGLVAGELAGWNPGNQVLGDVGLVVAGEGAWTPAPPWVGDVGSRCETDSLIQRVTPWATANSLIDLGGPTPWGNPINAKFLDNVWTTRTLIPGGPGGTSNLLQASDWGFAISLAAKVDGLEVQIYRRRTGVGVANLKDSVIQLTGPFGTSAPKANPANWTIAPLLAPYGGPNDDWGVAPTAGDVNDLTFAVEVSAFQTTGTPKTAEIDVIQIRVYYTIP